MGNYNGNTTTGEALGWGNVMSGLAATRIANAAARKGVHRYREAVLRAGGYNKEADDYRRMLDEGTQDSDASGKAERLSMMAEAGIHPDELLVMWRKAFSDVASQVGYRTEEAVRRAAVEVAAEIEVDVRGRLDKYAEEIAEQRAAEERRAAAETHRNYLEGLQSSAQELLRQLFGSDVFVGDTEMVHVDGRLDTSTLAIIYTGDPGKAAPALPAMLQTPGAMLFLERDTVVSTFLEDGTGTHLVEAKYSGSKRLH